jgi:hypothetical protein
MTKDQIIELIRIAFEPNEYPGDWCLKNSTEGNEPYLVETEFKGKTDWEDIDVEFLDQAPQGYASALSFFSDEAFRFYLPAYLVADLEGKLLSSDPTFHLTHGLDDASMYKLINPRRYGCKTWFDYARSKFAMFLREEVEAIVAYLEYKMASTDLQLERESISQAIKNFWKRRQNEARPRASLWGIET